MNCKEKPHVICHEFIQLHLQIKNVGNLDEEHGFLEQNNHGNLENQSDENDIISHICHMCINTFIVVPLAVQLYCTSGISNFTPLLNQ